MVGLAYPSELMKLFPIPRISIIGNLHTMMQFGESSTIKHNVHGIKQHIGVFLH
jgi:hypothetical protein